MNMPRAVAVETLDTLAEDDPAAIRSRGDLRRIHRAMGTRSIVRRALRDAMAARTGAAPLRILELGAGDGRLMLGVARSLAPAWPQVELTLLDRKALLDRATIGHYAEIGWTAGAAVADVFDWAAEAAEGAQRHGKEARWDLIVANLFLHHFEDAGLAVLLGAIAARAERFCACEPHRAWLALAASRLVGAIGANRVTREDAVLSVHAGFCGNELTALWPAHGAGWHLREYKAGLFSHCFGAIRLGAA
jgi:hypothetical protein